MEIYHYIGGSYVNWQYESYLHVDPTAETNLYYGSAVWKRWNNKNASVPFWTPFLEQFKMNQPVSGGSDGYYLGTTHSVSVVDPACTTGNHVHQESDSDGVYRPGLYIGQLTTSRWTDLHYVTLSGIQGTAP